MRKRPPTRLPTQSRRAIQATQQERARVVAHLILQGASRTAILHYTEHPQPCSDDPAYRASRSETTPWGIKSRQVDAVIRAAGALLKEAALMDVDDRRARVGARMDDVYAKARAKGELRVALASLEAKAKLYGLNEPTKLDLGGEIKVAGVQVFLPAQDEDK